ncbi:hypothetical protein [Brevibacterium gallinarum]|nr:hypothetical protein [Brevibacterium gallinarum]
MADKQNQNSEAPAFSKIGVRPAGVALHSSNHNSPIALSAWK